MSEEYIAEVELCGHKAKVGHITGQVSDNLWHKEDSLYVWLTFEEPVEGTISFGIDVPAWPYSRAAFLNLVVKEGEKAVIEWQGKHKREKADMEAREHRQQALDKLAQGVENEVTK